MLSAVNGQSRKRNRPRAALAALSVTGCAIAALAPGIAQGGPLPRIDTSDADRCDFIAKPNNGLCLLPFPDDYYTVSDPSTPTGRRVNLKTAAMPANVDGKHIDARPYNLNDGFSPGQPIVLKVPGLNSAAAMDRTGAVPINHIGRYRDPEPADRRSSTPTPASGGRSGPRSTPTPPSPAGWRWRSTRPGTWPPTTATSSPCET